MLKYSLLLFVIVAVFGQYNDDNREITIRINPKKSGFLKLHGCRMVVSLQDAGQIGAPAVTLQSVEYGIRHLPTSLKLKFKQSLLANTKRPSIEVRISKHGKLQYINDMNVPLQKNDQIIRISVVRAK